ncbi:A-kinase anchor protein 12 isoform X2 [Phyllobates terribilis]|uniref:A-kinase anchor protein 12 isoform X2 n=1 Tax=Phyllobates terribilis TaxID=111132 RepID=UPI003CCAF37F
MGAGTSTEQVADKPTEEQVEQCIDLGQEEPDGQEVEVNAADDAKLLHKNGKIAIINGAADEGGVEEGLQVSDVNGHEIEEILAVVKEVEQQEPASVTLDEESAENMGVVHNDTTPTETAKENGQHETPEASATAPESEEKAKSPDQANENQTNEVGFKKVFKFVGFKFTVKKDKSEKSDPVQLITVKKDEVEVNGTDNHEEHTDIRDDEQKESQQEMKDSEQPAENVEKPEQAAESTKELQEENQKKEEESEIEKKSPESPTNPAVTETSSPFRRFFTQGWAGLRKRTSFKKSKEEDPQEVEKHIKVEEHEKAEAPETVKEESATETQPAADLSVKRDLSKSSSEESKVSNNENIQNTAEEKPKEEPSPIKEVEVKLEEYVKVVEGVAPVTENAENTPETVTSVPEETAVPDVKSTVDILKDIVESQITDGIAVASSSTIAEGISEDLQGTTDSGDVDNDQPQLASSTESGEQEKSQEAITTEAEFLSSQEKAKIQGSPLKKLFSSSGLRKLSGKKSKSKKEDDGKVEIATEAVSSESPEALEIDGGDSSPSPPSPSSPDESAETSPTEKTLDDPQQAAEAEGEGTTSDGERKKDGITPWASFKKLVTPKRRPKRPSESDKEDEVERAKTSTMSSTESAGVVENLEEPKEINEEQKLEKSTEESKKKVDSSVSWEALICVGSSKKRGRKTSDSDEDEGVKSQDEAKKTEEVVPAKEIDSDSPITSPQEQQNQESTSPDQAGSPTEADGVSTWQSFKRLVTPRRKSRTRVEEKTDETAATNAEQSTSEGEAGKEETWSSFKKLIPGRKKKKSDGKQEHSATTETGQPLSEAAEDDSDEPAVVPLAEFDAAEQEKLDALKSLEEALPTVLGQQQRSLEKSTEELIHAVTVTVIEGERAITNLEERSPSWISATVSETIEHAKETEEAAEIIKTEVTIEETVVLSAVSQVMTEIPNTLINEMELTSEALTALEEAIENSCAEETTEMISAVSQLGGSVVSTEEATPVPEEDASVKTLEDQKKHTENILHEAAEKAKLSIDTLQTSQDKTDFQAPMDDQEIICESAPLCVEEEINLSPVSLEEQGDKSTIYVEATVHQIEVQEDINAPIDTLDQAVNICVGPLISNEEQADQSTDAILSSSEDQVKETSTHNKAEDVTSVKTEEKCEDASDSVVTDTMAHESTTALQAVCAKHDSLSVEDVTVASEVQAEDVIPMSSELKSEVAPVSCEVQTEEIGAKLQVVQPEEIVPLSNEMQPEEVVPVVSEVQPEEVVPVVSEVQPEEVVPVVSEVQPEEVVPVVSEVQPEEVVPVVSEVQPEEVVPVVSEVQPEEVVPVVSEVQSEEVVPVVSEVQPEEVVPVVSEVQPEEVVPVVSEVQPEEVVPVVSEVQPEEVVPVVSEVQPEEVVPVVSEVQPEEVVPVVSEVQPEEVVPVVSEVQPEEVVPVVSEAQPEEVVPVVSELPMEELALGSNKIQPEEVVSMSSEIQAEEVAPQSSEIQHEVAVLVSSQLQSKETVPVSSKMQPEEAAPVSSELKFDETVPVSNEVQSEEVILASIELQPEEVVPSMVQSEEVIPESSDVQFEEVSVSNELQPEETMPLSNEVGSEEVLFTSIEVQPEEIASVSNEVKPEESVSVTNEVLVEVELSASNKLQSDVGSVSTKLKNGEVQKNEECIPVCHDIVDESDVTASTEASEKVKAEEGISVAEMDKECAPTVSIEVQPEEGLGVQIEEQVNENVSLSDTIQPEVQAEESVAMSDEIPVEVYAIVFSEAKVEDHTPEPAEMQAEETAVVSDAIQVEAYAFVLPEAKVEESTSKSIKVQAEDSAKVSSNVQVAESFQGPADVQAEGSVQKSDELKPAEISPVVPVKELVQVDECISLLEDKQIEIASHVATKVLADQIAPAAIEQKSDVKSQVSEVQSDVTPSLLMQDDAIASSGVMEEQKKHTQEEIVEMKEEVVTTDIPELESSEAIKASEPVTAAAVEEKVLTETVKTIEIPKDRIEPSEVADDERSEESETLSKGLQIVAESVSQKAAAIVDAAIEAATNCFVVDATGQGDKLEEITVSEKVEVTEENDIQTITIESCSTTIVHNIVETSVEKVISNMVSVQEQNLENELNSHLQTVPVHEPIKLYPQLEESEKGKAEEEQKPQKEIESVVSFHAQEKNEISTQASDAQEKAPIVES